MTKRSVLSDWMIWWPVVFWIIQVVVSLAGGKDTINVWTVVAGITISVLAALTLAWKVTDIHRSIVTRERIAHEAEMFALATAHGWTVADRKDDGTGKVTITLLYGDALKREHERREADHGGE